MSSWLPEMAGWQSWILEEHGRLRASEKNRRWLPLYTHRSGSHLVIDTGPGRSSRPTDPTPCHDLDEVPA